MNKFEYVLICIYASILSFTANAEDSIRNGNPCLNGVCIGDEISTLTASGVKWQPPQPMGVGGKTIPLKINDSDLKGVLQDFSPTETTAVTAAAPYLKWNAFDSQGIIKLAKVTGFCNRGFGVVGTFISESGHKTFVTANVVPGADPSSQSIRVTLIERSFPREYTRDQLNELSKQLAERYAGIKKVSSRMFAHSAGTLPSWAFEVSSETKLSLMAPSDSFLKINDQLKKYPGCGKSLKID
jgi:hypothetical protein